MVHPFWVSLFIIFTFIASVHSCFRRSDLITCLTFHRPSASSPLRVLLMQSALRLEQTHRISFSGSRKVLSARSRVIKNLQTLPACILSSSLHHVRLAQDELNIELTNRRSENYLQGQTIYKTSYQTQSFQKG